MISGISSRRGTIAMFWLLPTAVLIALTPTTGLGFTPSAHPGSCPCNHPAQAKHYHRFPRWFLPCAVPQSPALSLSSSASDSPSTYGSSAVRSLKPPPASGRLQLLSFYRFAPIPQPDVVRDALFDRLGRIEGLRGTVYVASEGVNAQFAVGEGEPLDELLRAFRDECSGGCLPFDAFERDPPNMGSVVDRDTPTFDRLLVRTRDFILRDGMEEVDGRTPLDWDNAGVELDPSEWDEQLRLSDVQLLDCRNAYESDQGSFASATPLNTQTFSETWSVLDDKVDSRSIDPSEPVYIFCTGGIRCVKVGAYLKQRLGVKDVRSLRHGIVGYERWRNQDSNHDIDTERTLSNGDSNTKQSESLWVGENFLFDKRRFAKEDIGEADG